MEKSRGCLVGHFLTMSTAVAAVEVVLRCYVALRKRMDAVSCARLNEAFFHKHGSFRRDEVALARPLGERGQLAPYSAAEPVERLATTVGDPA